MVCMPMFGNSGVEMSTEKMWFSVSKLSITICSTLYKSPLSSFMRLATFQFLILRRATSAFSIDLSLNWYLVPLFSLLIGAGSGYATFFLGTGLTATGASLMTGFLTTGALSIGRSLDCC